MFKLFLVYVIVHHVAVAYRGSSLCNSRNYYDQKLEICALECCGRSCPDECRHLFCLCNIGCCNNDSCKICYLPIVHPSICFKDEDCPSGSCDQHSYKCSSSGYPIEPRIEHGSVETTIEPAEDELFTTPVQFSIPKFTLPTRSWSLTLPNRSSSASFHLTTVKIVLIAVGCLFLIVPVVIIAFILDVRRRHANSRQALLPETVIASSTSTSTERVPQLNSAEDNILPSTEFAVQNPNQHPEMSLAPSTFHRGPPPPYTPHARPSTPPPSYDEASVRGHAA